VAYPGHGITKSIRSAIKSKTRQHAVQARMREGRYLMNLENIKVKRSLVLRAFEALKREEKSATTYSAPKRA
jgi:hypothetical protein